MTYILVHLVLLLAFSFFSFHNPATTEIYTLSLHDALPIYDLGKDFVAVDHDLDAVGFGQRSSDAGVTLKTEDRKSTRLNSSHRTISYAVFCLKKKKKHKRPKILPTHQIHHHTTLTVCHKCQ